MALLARFDTPASIRDMPAGSPFYDDWHDLVRGLIAAETSGSFGSFYDPTERDVAEVGQRLLTWTAFPRDLIAANRDDRATAYHDADDDRDNQNEYCEWHVDKDSSCTITKVSFTTEFPEYWQELWDLDRSKVVDLYRTLVDPAITETDLVFAGTTTYDKNNDKNLVDGIAHLRQSINTLRDAVGLSQGSVERGSPSDNYDIAIGRTTAVDPRVILDVRSLTRKGLWVTFVDPVGIYIVDWNDDGWTKPSGAPVGDYWRIVRGRPGQVLRLEYEVPASEGFRVGDIRIGGRPIEYGSQIAEHVTVSILGTAGSPGR